MKPHKHAELIKAWADGAEIQFRLSDSEWLDTADPNWAEFNEYRIKPQKKKIRYRLFLTRCQISGVHVVRAAMGYGYVTDDGFISWLTDWQEVEVEE